MCCVKMSVARVEQQLSGERAIAMISYALNYLHGGDPNSPSLQGAGQATEQHMHRLRRYIIAVKRRAKLSISRSVFGARHAIPNPAYGHVPDADPYMFPLQSPLQKLVRRAYLSYVAPTREHPEYPLLDILWRDERAYWTMVDLRRVARGFEWRPESLNDLPSRVEFQEHVATRSRGRRRVRSGLPIDQWHN